MSLVQCLTAIIKRKMKAVQIALIPTPPKPLPEKVPLPPTSADVAKPEMTWDDVKTALKEEYKFSEKDAGEIIDHIKEFFDGTCKLEQVITGINMRDSGVKQGECDELPIFAEWQRYQMTPLYCKDTWIPDNIEKGELVGEGVMYCLRPPMKLKDTSKKGLFHEWMINEKGETEDRKLDYDEDWAVLEDYMSEVK